MTPRRMVLPMSSAELIDSAIPPRIVVGSRIESTDPEWMGIRGTVLAIEGVFLKTRWDDGEISHHRAQRVELVFDTAPALPPEPDSYTDYIAELHALSHSPPPVHDEKRERAIGEAQKLLYKALEILGGAK